MPMMSARGRQGLSVAQALAEAQRCMLCHDAPCSDACPGGTDPGKFIRQIRFYNFKGAARTVLGNNPLGGVCAFVCPTSDTCVRACLRSGLDRPIDIDGLQRFAVEYGRQVGLKVLARGEPIAKRVAVIGAGPAGLTAAALLAEHGYQVTLYEARAKAGGMLRYGVPAARLSDEALDADLSEIMALGVELKTGMPIVSENGVHRLIEDGFAAVFVAPGLWRPLALELPGAGSEGTSTAIELLEQARTEPGKARALVAGKNVAIIGGGSVAMDVATTVRRFGAGRIYAIALEGMTELPAMSNELDEAREIGLVIKPQCQVTAILGENGKITGVEGCETEWIEPGKLVPSNARPIAGTSFRLKVEVVIQAIGQGPTDAVGGIIAAAITERGLIAVQASNGATAVEHVFAGGDIVRGAGTVVEAVGDGKRAARAIHELLSGKEASR